MEQFNVTGMSCAACSARVEKAVSQVPGVTSCSVSLLTNSMGVEGTVSDAEIIEAVQKAGYGGIAYPGLTNGNAIFTAAFVSSANLSAFFIISNILTLFSL